MMLMFKDSCTILNHYIDENDADQYQEMILNGVHWEGSRSVQAESGGYGNSSNILVVVPCHIGGEGQYISPADFDALTDKANYWTLREGDKMRRNGEEMTITSISCYEHGALAHWEVGGQ